MENTIPRTDMTLSLSHRKTNIYLLSSTKADFGDILQTVANTFSLKNDNTLKKLL